MNDPDCLAADAYWRATAASAMLLPLIRATRDATYMPLRHYADIFTPLFLPPPLDMRNVSHFTPLSLPVATSYATPARDAAASWPC